MAVVPLFADQPWNAERVDAVGAGIALGGGPEAAIAGLRDAVVRLTGDPSYRSNAQRDRRRDARGCRPSTPRSASCAAS